MRCPSCTTEVPPARFCARCGDRLNDAAAAAAPSPGATRRFFVRASEQVPRSGWRAAVGMVAVLAVAGVGTAVAPERRAVDAQVTLPAEPAGRTTADAEAASPPPFREFPAATVVCSDFADHPIGSERLGDADVGETVEVHGGTCVVTAVEADAEPRPYPRGVARGNRPGTGPPGSGR